MKIRVMSYNTQSGFANGRQIYNYAAQAGHIAANNPDIVALQEVAINHPAAEEKVDYPAAVAKRLGMEYCYAKALDFAGCDGKYGVAILSKYPMEKLAEIKLPVPEGIEPRVAVVARIVAPVPFYMVCTHLSFQGEFEGDGEGRIEQLQTIFRYLDENQCYPVLLAGDLNSQPQDESIQTLREKFEVFNDGRDDRPTAYSSKFGWVQIDYIAGAPAGRCKCERFTRGDDCTVSDHYAVMADLEL